MLLKSRNFWQALRRLLITVYTAYKSKNLGPKEKKIEKEKNKLQREGSTFTGEKKIQTAYFPQHNQSKYKLKLKKKKTLMLRYYVQYSNDIEHDLSISTFSFTENDLRLQKQILDEIFFPKMMNFDIVVSFLPK